MTVFSAQTVMIMMMLLLIMLLLLSKINIYIYIYIYIYIRVVPLSAKDNPKGFERSLYWNEYKTKSEDKNTTNEYGYFLESNFVGVHRLFVLLYSNQD